MSSFTLANALPVSIVPIVLTVSVITSAAAAADSDPPPAVDRVFELRRMQDFEPFLDNIAPGTRLELVSGAYRPQTLRGVRGTAERPIVICGSQSGAQPVIAGGEVGLHLIDCAHVVIDGLAFSGQSEAAIRIESSVGADEEANSDEHVDSDEHVNWASESIRLVRVRIHVLRNSADGLDIRRSVNVTIDDLLVRNWGRAAVRIADSADVRIDGCRLLAFGSRSHPIGIEVVEGTRRLSITGLRAEHRIVEALRLGMSGVGVGGITVHDSLFHGVETGIRIGTIADLDLHRCTFAEITGAVLDFSDEVDAARGANSTSPTPAERVRSVRLASSIIDWSRRPLADLVRGAFDGGLRLGTNLWFGPEAAARVAAVETDSDSDQQVTDRDPALDVHGSASPEVAEEFGARGKQIEPSE